MWASGINVQYHCFWDKMWKVDTTVEVKEHLGLDSAFYFLIFLIFFLSSQDLRQLLNRLRPAYTAQDLMLAIFYVYRGQLRLICLTPASWFSPHNGISIWLMENEFIRGFWRGLKSLLVGKQLLAAPGWSEAQKLSQGLLQICRYWREKGLIEYCKEHNKSCCGNICRNILWVLAGYMNV